MLMNRTEARHEEFKSKHHGRFDKDAWKKIQYRREQKKKNKQYN